MYIDVRGVWPVLVINLIAVELEGVSRSITVKEAIAWTVSTPEVINISERRRLTNDFPQ
jgi:hypothetical protein